MIRVSKREAPSPNQCATSTVIHVLRLYLNTFRGEPAISGFAWHFTATHKSSQPFVTDPGSGLHARIPRASPCSWVDHLVSGLLDATRCPFGLAFAPAPPISGLTSRRPRTRWLILQKARRHPQRGSDRPDADGFRISFTPHHGVLFTVPSRYWCTIGRRGYLALGRGRPCFPPDSACPAVLTFMTHPAMSRSPTGLSPSSVRCSNTLQLDTLLKARGLLSSPVITFNPIPAAAAASYAEMVWALPGSLAATTGILSFPRGT